MCKFKQGFICCAGVNTGQRLKAFVMDPTINRPPSSPFLLFVYLSLSFFRYCFQLYSFISYIACLNTLFFVNIQPCTLFWIRLINLHFFCHRKLPIFRNWSSFALLSFRIHRPRIHYINYHKIKSANAI